jgi:hypothetical protein
MKRSKKSEMRKSDSPISKGRLKRKKFRVLSTRQRRRKRRSKTRLKLKPSNIMRSSKRSESRKKGWR